MCHQSDCYSPPISFEFEIFYHYVQFNKIIEPFSNVIRQQLSQTFNVCIRNYYFITKYIYLQYHYGRPIPLFVNLADVMDLFTLCYSISISQRHVCVCLLLYNRDTE